MNENKAKETILLLLHEYQNLMLWFQRWLDANRFRCGHCNKDKMPTSYYQLKSNTVYRGGRIPICKKCINELFRCYERKYQDSYRAMQKICQLFDIYYDYRLFGSVIDDENIVGRYLQKLNLRQNKYKIKLGFDGSLFEKRKTTRYLK